MDACNEGLPSVDPEMVHNMQMEYDEAFRTASSDLEAARFRLIWVMVHSTDQQQVGRGLQLAKTQLQDSRLKPKDQRELQYLAAVACMRLGKYVESRRILKELMLTHPDFRQAEALATSVDDKILREGLIGAGIGAAALGVVGFGLAVLLGSGRR